MTHCALCFFFVRFPFRLAKAFEELSEFIKNEDDMKQSKEYELALTLLDEAKLQLA